MLNQGAPCDGLPDPFMNKSVALLFGVHAHQPVGNFPAVMNDAHLRCYKPFLYMMEKYPSFRFSIHVSGWLLDYLKQHYPEDMDLLERLVSRGQAELFGAGYTEPVLASIPVRDRLGQLNQMSHLLSQSYGSRPVGAWLTERVWDSTVIPSLADTGIRYVTVDDYHFLCAGVQQEALKGFFSTEEDGRRLDVFPISEALRYRLPFSPADEAVRYLESLADYDPMPAAIYFDDIEKFGIWPETYDWVYTQGWLENFIRGILESSCIEPMRYQDYHEKEQTSGVIYLPTTSYIEMNEWSLPSEAAHRYARLVERSRGEGTYEQDKAFLRGGIWKNFLSRYPESNWMHKRMLGLSSRLHGIPESRQTTEMKDLLYEAQANDAYWHGLFGGLYLPHLRRAVYRALVKLEALLDQIEPARELVFSKDLDLDGHVEHFIKNEAIQLVIRGGARADLRELDDYLLHHNFADTLTRKTEHYHHLALLKKSSAHDGEGISNPHEKVSFKHDIQPEDMVIDLWPRGIFMDHKITGQDKTPVLYEIPPLKHSSDSLSFKGLSTNDVEKRYAVNGRLVRVQYDFGDWPEGSDFEGERNLAMPSCDGPAGFFRIGDHVPGGFGQALRLENCTMLELHDKVLGGALELSCSEPALLATSPCFSVSQSEAGFEKIMQALTVRLRWASPEKGQSIVVRLGVA